MDIREGTFCGLARNPEWQKWLLEIAPDLHAQLLDTLEHSRGCHTNRDKMLEILSVLKIREKMPEFEQLVRERFPYVEDKKSGIKAKLNKKQQKFTTQRPIPTTRDEHGVFKIYKPHLLTFPAKIIISDKDRNSLERRLFHFIRNKIGVDYLIIGNRAYVEYFFPQYRATLEKMSADDREIAKFRRLKSLPPDAKEMKEVK